MSSYTFTFKKDDISVEFTTTNKDVVAEQFRIWVEDAEEYTKTHQPKNEEKKTLNTGEMLKTAEKAFNKKPQVEQKREESFVEKKFEQKITEEKQNVQMQSQPEQNTQKVQTEQI